MKIILKLKDNVMSKDQYIIVSIDRHPTIVITALSRNITEPTCLNISVSILEITKYSERPNLSDNTNMKKTHKLIHFKVEPNRPTF